MEIRVAKAPDAWELDSLARIADFLAHAPPPPGAGVVALGHGGPSGVHNGATERTYVLGVSDAPSFASAWALTVACDTAPAFVTALVNHGLARAAGFTEELRLPSLADSSDAEIRILGAYILAIAHALATARSPADLDKPLYDAQRSFFDAWGMERSFLVAGFAEQLRDAFSPAFGSL